MTTRYWRRALSGLTVCPVCRSAFPFGWVLLSGCLFDCAHCCSRHQTGATLQFLLRSLEFGALVRRSGVWTAMAGTNWLWIRTKYNKLACPNSQTEARWGVQTEDAHFLSAQSSGILKFSLSLLGIPNQCFRMHSNDSAVCPNRNFREIESSRRSSFK